MLDFTKLLEQIDAVGVESLVDRFSFLETLTNAQEVFDEAQAQPDRFEQRQNDNSSFALWPVALPLEPLDTIDLVRPVKDAVTVIGVDGSQILPSHHEVHNCYLLNIGIAAISYGSRHAAILETSPRLYHRPEDLYPLVDRRRMHIDELYVSLERGLLELEVLADKAIQMKERALPVVALYDGSLISWSAEKMPPGYQETYFERMDVALERFRTSGIPLVGYLSHSRSSDVVNCLRVFTCPYEVSHCRVHCGHLNEEEFPCSRVWPLADRQLLETRLDISERSCVFASGASASKMMASINNACFAYIRFPSEVARLEFPRWVMDSRELFDLALGAVSAQVDKGQGYPVALQEAHHLAVIRGADRQTFFDLMTKHLISIGADRIHVSPKESRKRTGFI